jgi:hypothetical protein
MIAQLVLSLLSYQQHNVLYVKRIFRISPARAPVASRRITVLRIVAATELIEHAPVRDVSGHQSLEQAAVVRNTEVQQLVRNHKIPEAGFLIIQVRRQGAQ